MGLRWAYILLISQCYIASFVFAGPYEELTGPTKDVKVVITHAINKVIVNHSYLKMK